MTCLCLQYTRHLICPKQLKFLSWTTQFSSSVGFSVRNVFPFSPVQLSISHWSTCWKIRKRKLRRTTTEVCKYGCFRCAFWHVFCLLSCVQGNLSFFQTRCSYTCRCVFGTGTVLCFPLSFRALSTAGIQYSLNAVSYTHLTLPTRRTV